MATTIRIIKNTFNKAQWVKYNTLREVVLSIKEECYPNGNAGFDQVVCRRLFQGLLGSYEPTYPGLLVKYYNGDPSTMNHMVLDPSRLTSDQVEDMKKRLST